MNRFRTLSYFLKCVSQTQSGESLRKNVSKTAVRFCSSANLEKPSTFNNEEKPSVLEPVEKLKFTYYGPKIPKKFNFAMIADEAPIVQKYIDLGVDLYEVQKNPEAANYLLTLNMEKLKTYLFFLTDNGVPAERLGHCITKNPMIFKEDLDDLKVRINYLKSKKFDKDMISKIITNYTKWLSFPVKKVDERLGFLQVTFHLKGDHIREIITRVPSLVGVKKEIIMMNSHALKEEMDLDVHTLKKVILSEPQLLRISSFDFISTFDYLTKTMKVSKDLILNQPHILTTRKFILEERHKFLESLGRAQYCHLLPGYVDLLSLVTLNDVDFCERVAKTSVELFHNFLKTL